MAPNIPSVTLCSSFLILPLELRQQIYEEYFAECSRLDEEIHENVLPEEYPNFTVPFLLVNTQLSEEVLDFLRQRKQYVYRITWEKACLDGLAISCVRARKIQCDDYANFPHLKVEIYPPHPDPPSDMMNMLRSIMELCKDLRAVDRLQHISIVFVEDDVATWAFAGKPRMSMGPWQEVEGTPDIEHVLYLFATLTNTATSTIELPDSVKSDSNLQEKATSHEQSMMNIDLLDEEFVSLCNEILEEDLDDNERYIRWDTGDRSLARWKAQGYHLKYTTARGHVKYFTHMWPHMDSLPGNEYEDDTGEGYTDIPYEGCTRVATCSSPFWHDRGCLCMT